MDHLFGGELLTEKVVAEAVRASAFSSCEKSTRGVVLFHPSSPEVPMFPGWNHTPKGFACTGTQTCRQNCNKICVHAEQHSLLQLSPKYRSDGWHLVHVKTVNHKLVPSGPPSCWQCSRLILDCGAVSDVWLFHETGWKSYSALDFHTLTLRECGLLEDHALPVLRGIDSGRPGRSITAADCCDHSPTRYVK